MLRIALGVIAGFIAWMIMWVGTERLLSAVMPEWYGTPQAAFQNAIENGGQFTAETRLLLAHLAIVTLVSGIAGLIAATAAGESSRTPLIFAVLLLLTGIAKSAMSWAYVPLWYHVGFTVILVSMAIVGGKLKS